MELVSEWAIFLAISLSELLFWQRNGAKYSESEIKKDNFTVKLSFLFNLENSVILRYTRNIVQLNSFYIKFDSKHFYLYNKYYN
jgi:hypothetical protein